MTDPSKFPPAPPPECVQCGDKGWIEAHEPSDPSGTTRARECSCVRTRHYRQRMEYLERENARFRDLTLKTYEPENEAQEKVLAACAEWAAAWPRVERGVMLMGMVGVGKTGLLWATAKAAGEKECVPPHILRAPDLAEAPAFHGQHDDRTEPTRNEIIAYAVRQRILIFDDLGTGKRSESADGAFFRLLDKRHLACAPTLVTTNYTDKAVQMADGRIRETCERRIGSRLYSRLQQACDFYEITGDDRRQKA